MTSVPFFTQPPQSLPVSKPIYKPAYLELVMVNNSNENAIREAAYFIWQNAGCPSGRDQEFWAMAVEQFNCCNSKSSSKKSCSSSKKSTTATCKSTTAKKTSSKKSK